MYAELIAMGEGVRRPGDRSDISSDEEDEMEVLNTLLIWSRCPTSQTLLAEQHHRVFWYRFVSEYELLVNVQKTSPGCRFGIIVTLFSTNRLGNV